MIKKFEGSVDALRSDQLLLIIGCCDELSIVDMTIVICVSLLHHCHDTGLIELEMTADCGHILVKLIVRNLAIFISIILQEHLTQIFQVLCLGQQVGKDRADTGLERRCLGEAH